MPRCSCSMQFEEISLFLLLACLELRSQSGRDCRCRLNDTPSAEQDLALARKGKGAPVKFSRKRTFFKEGGERRRMIGTQQ